MKQITTTIIMVLLLVEIPGAKAADENPFGFKTQTHPLEYKYCKRVNVDSFNSQFWYECSSAPRMHPDVKNILLKHVEDVGLCAMLVGSYSIGDNISVDTFKDQITAKYGPHTGRTEADPKAYAEAGGYTWLKSEGFAGLGDVEAITLYKGYREGAYRVVVTFRFALYDRCDEVVEQRRMAAF